MSTARVASKSLARLTEGYEWRSNQVHGADGLQRARRRARRGAGSKPGRPASDVWYARQKRLRPVGAAGLAVGLQVLDDHLAGTTPPRPAPPPPRPPAVSTNAMITARTAERFPTQQAARPLAALGLAKQAGRTAGRPLRHFVFGSARFPADRKWHYGAGGGAGSGRPRPGPPRLGPASGAAHAASGAASGGDALRANDRARSTPPFLWMFHLSGSWSGVEVSQCGNGRWQRPLATADEMLAGLADT